MKIEKVFAKPSAQDSLLVGIGARLYRDAAGTLHIESQTVSGLKAWNKHFRHVTAFGICDAAEPPSGYIAVSEAGINPTDISFIELPDTYRLKHAWTTWPKAKALLRDAMRKASYLVFSYGGWLGDPGELAAQIARAEKRPHAVWLDRVESIVMGSKGSIPARTKAQIIRLHENRAVKTADLALLHGRTVYNHFHTIAKNPQISENIHLSDTDRIERSALEKKLLAIREGPLNIAYVGRAADMKGWRDWIQALKATAASGIAFKAVWLGGGERLDAMAEMAEQLGLNDGSLSFPGFETDRDKVKAVYQKAHLFLFCHQTDESPRNLIESLYGATPLIGYSDPFADGLVKEKGAGFLVRRGDYKALAEIIETLDKDRNSLAKLIENAFNSARHLTRDQVFQERSEIVKRYL